MSRRTAIDTVRRESRRHAREAAADIRVALAKLRSVARKKFATSLQAALRRYLAGSPDLGVALKAMKLQWDGESLNFSCNFEWGGKKD